MKIYIICCFPAQIQYFGKFLFQTYGPECCHPIRLQDYLMNHISRMNELNSLIFCICGGRWGGHGQKMGVVSLVSRLKN